MSGIKIILDYFGITQDYSQLQTNIPNKGNEK